MYFLFLEIMILILDIIGKYNNVHYLNCDTYNHKDGITIAGCTLWSKPLILKKYKEIAHLNKHNEHVEWIKNVINYNKYN